MGLLYSCEVGLCEGMPARVVLLNPTGEVVALLYTWPQGRGVSPEKAPRPWAKAEAAEKSRTAERDEAKNLFMTKGFVGVLTGQTSPGRSPFFLTAVSPRTDFRQ